MRGPPWAYKTNSVSRETAGGINYIIFRNVRKALHSALDMQRVLKRYNEGRDEAEQILLCVGLGFGRVLRIGDSDVFGAEVNAASKLGEDRAGPWEILVTDSVRDRCARFPELNVQFERLDEAPPGADSAYRVLFEL